jgi:hypothetical protein
MKPVVLSLASLSIFCTATLAMSVVADSRDTTQNHTNTTQPVLVEHTATHYTHQVEFIQTRNMAATRRIAIQEAVRLAKDERSLAVQLAKAQATLAEETVDEAEPIVKIEDVPKRVPAANTAPEPTVPRRVQSVSVTPKQTTSLPVTQPPVTAVATLIEKTVEPIVIADAYTTVLIKEIHRLTNLERKKLASQHWHSASHYPPSPLLTVKIWPLVTTFHTIPQKDATRVVVCRKLTTHCLPGVKTSPGATA